MFQLRAVAQRRDRSRFLSVANVCELAPQREKAAAPFFIDLAGETLLRVDVGLITLHHPLGDVRPLDAAVLDAAVSAIRARQTVLHLEFEIGGLAIAPAT